MVGRWCPYCGGLMLEYVDGGHEQCLDCNKAIQISPTVKAAKASGQVIVGLCLQGTKSREADKHGR